MRSLLVDRIHRSISVLQFRGLNVETGGHKVRNQIESLYPGSTVTLEPAYMEIRGTVHHPDHPDDQEPIRFAIPL